MRMYEFSKGDYEAFAGAEGGESGEPLINRDHIEVDGNPVAVVVDDNGMQIMDHENNYNWMRHEDYRTSMSIAKCMGKDLESLGLEHMGFDRI